MADKVVLSEMVVKITGDNQDLQRKLKQGEQDTQKFGREVGKVGARSLPAVDHSKVHAKNTQAATNYREALSKISPQLGMLTKAGIGLGAGIFIFRGLRSEAMRWYEETVKGARAAVTAYQEVATGAKLAGSAVAGARINLLTEGMQGLSEQITRSTMAAEISNVRDVLVGAVRDTESWGQAFQNLFNLTQGQVTGRGGVQVAVDRIIGRVRDMERAFEEIQQNPAMRNFLRRVNVEREIDGLVTLNRTLEQTAERSNLTASAAARLQQVQEIANRTNMSRNEIEQRFRRLLDRGQESQRLAAAGELTRSLREQVQLFGLSAEAAQLMRLRLDGVSESSLAAAAAHVQQLQALRRLQAPMDRIEGTVASSADAQFRIADFQRQRAFEISAAQIQIAPQRTGEAAVAGSAEALGRAAEVPQILRDIRTILRRQGVGTQVTFTTANLED